MGVSSAARGHLKRRSIQESGGAGKKYPRKVSARRQSPPAQSAGSCRHGAKAGQRQFTADIACQQPGRLSGYPCAARGRGPRLTGPWAASLPRSAALHTFSSAEVPVCAAAVFFISGQAAPMAPVGRPVFRPGPPAFSASRQERPPGRVLQAALRTADLRHRTALAYRAAC